MAACLALAMNPPDKGDIDILYLICPGVLWVVSLQRELRVGELAHAVGLCIQAIHLEGGKSIAYFKVGGKTGMNFGSDSVTHSTSCLL